MSEEKKGLFSKEYTRRQFMKLTGKGLAGVALSSSLLSLMGATAGQVEAEMLEVLPLPDKLLVFNRAKCTACQRCEANCTLKNDKRIQPYVARIRVRDNMNYGEEGPQEDHLHGQGIFGNWQFDAETCRQCKDAPCVHACPVDAIAADENNGARVIDEEICIGCGACVQACPWHIPRINPLTNKSTKCINCGACVDGCPTSALTLIDWEDVANAMA